MPRRHVQRRHAPQRHRPEAENFSSFALTPEGIRIFFQPYQVAPWAAGSQVVDIPLDALADAGPRLSLWGK
ncbi:MAG: RsiV family protein [Bilophila wadsworthia]